MSPWDALTRFRPRAKRTLPSSPELGGHPYRTPGRVLNERDWRGIYEAASAAVDHFNSSCPNGFTMEPLTLNTHTIIGVWGDYRMVCMHGDRFYFSGDPMRSRTEFCCTEQLSAFKKADAYLPLFWRLRWRRRRDALNPAMIK
jgi:hypothetical protein